MAAPTGTKLQLPQIERIRPENTHIADALSEIVKYVNLNTTPAAGNAVTPVNSQVGTKQAKITPLNALK